MWSSPLLTVALPTFSIAFIMMVFHSSRVSLETLETLPDVGRRL